MSFQEDRFREIANAIRTKTNKTTPIAANNFANEILSISTGDTPTPQPPIDPTKPIVRWFYRDTVTGQEKIVSTNVEVGGTAIPPSDVGDVQANIDNPALTFQRWNYTETELTNAQGNIDVGALYVPTDGKTYFRIRITHTTGADEIDALTQTLYLTKSSSYGTLNINWGDGSATESTTATGSLVFNHTYSQIGDYWITAWTSSILADFNFGHNSTSTTVFGGSVQSKRNILRHCFMGNNATISSYGLYNCYSLRSITTSYFGISTHQNALQGCYSLTSITIPDYGSPNIGNSAFYNCYNLNNISLPVNITSIGNSAFYNCYSLTSITIPRGLTSIGTSAFSGCNALIDYVFKRTTPPTLSNINAFNNINSITRIFVPDESVAAYKAATNWVTFANRIFPISERGTW